MRSENLIFLLMLFASLAPCRAGRAATYYAGSCSMVDVRNAISRASTGDTVRVPAGACKWTGLLGIDKGIRLIGAGIGKTTIINDYPKACPGVSGMINYKPSEGNFRRNSPIRVSGFSFDLGGNAHPCSGIFLDAGTFKSRRSPYAVIQTKIRIDHNRFFDGGSPWGPNSNGISNDGMRGVVDNNIFDGIGAPVRTVYQSDWGKPWWDNWQGIVYGRADNNMYFEDNTFTGITYMVTDCQLGNRYVFRYNTIIQSAQLEPAFDMHGNYGPIYGCFGGEIYGNLIKMNGHPITLVGQRGGKAIIFNNSIMDPSSRPIVKVYEECDDSYDPTTNVQPQHVSESYYWGNRSNGDGQFPMFAATTAAPRGFCHVGAETAIRYPGEALPVPSPNQDYWVEATSDGLTYNFNGTSGVGCGTLAARPATCTKGVGYWATSQSCSNLTGMVGAHPSTPIAGVFYKCVAPNTWRAYFTPLPYPHPLARSGAWRKNGK